MCRCSHRTCTHDFFRRYAAFHALSCSLMRKTCKNTPRRCKYNSSCRYAWLHAPSSSWIACTYSRSRRMNRRTAFLPYACSLHGFLNSQIVLQHARIPAKCMRNFCAPFGVSGVLHPLWTPPPRRNMLWNTNKHIFPQSKHFLPKFLFCKAIDFFHCYPRHVRVALPPTYKDRFYPGSSTHPPVVSFFKHLLQMKKKRNFTFTLHKKYLKSLCAARPVPLTSVESFRS